MKKQYIRPNTKYVPVEPGAPLASSDTSDSTVSIPVDNDNTYSGSFHAKQRQTILWDDDEEDE